MKILGIRLLGIALIITGMVLGMVGCDSSESPTTPATPEPPKVITLKMNHGQFPPVIMNSKAGQWWGEQIEARTDGRVVVKQFYAGSMSTGGEVIDFLRNGLSDVAEITVPFYPQDMFLNHGPGAHAAPFGPNDQKMFLDIMTKLRAECPELDAEIAAFNGKFLFYCANSDYCFEGRMPIKSLEDMKGKKVQSNGEWSGLSMAAIGATQLAMETGERYTSLQTGVSDVSFLEPTLSYGFKLYEVAPNLTWIHWGSYPAMLYAINIDVWKSLPPDIQQIIEEVSQEAALWYIEQRAAQLDRIIAELTSKHGVTIYDFTQKDVQKWANLMPDLPARFIDKGTKRGLAAEKVMKSYLRLCSEAGHKWPREWLQGN